MNRHLLLLFTITLSLITSTLAQEPAKTYEDITFSLPPVGKVKTTYFTFTLGAQTPFWAHVPMVPENSQDINKHNENQVNTKGWFAGAGIIKKTKSPLEAGFLFDYMKTSVPVAIKGQRSYGDWILEQDNQTDRYTQVQENDIDRIARSFIIRAVCRYKHLLGKASIWAGLAAGTYSSLVSFEAKTQNDKYGAYRQISLGAGFQAGAGFIVRNKSGTDLLGINIFGDFFSPELNERYFNLFNTGWVYENTSGNPFVSPVRIGVSFDLH